MYLFATFWGGMVWGVGVIFNNSSNLIMNLWNLFSQLQYYSWLKLGMPVFNEMPTLSFFWMRMKTNINLSIKLIFQNMLF